MTSVTPSVPPPRTLRQSLGLSRAQMARLFDVSARTIERWESRDMPPASLRVRKRFAELQEIADLAQIIYKPESVTRFLTTPFPTFAGRTALQIIEADRADLVMDALAADYEGIGS